MRTIAAVLLLCTISLANYPIEEYSEQEFTSNPSVDFPEGRIAFISELNGKGEWDVFLIDTDGSNQTQLTFNSLTGSRPAWSPDGRRIAYDSFCDGAYTICLIDVDGSNQTRLIFNSRNDEEPAWSPNGLRIVFTSDRDGDYEIFMMDADGSNQTQLTFNSSDDREPAWSPDSSRIIFSSDRDGDYELFVMDTDGSNQIQLTLNEHDDTLPAWSPDGRRVIFEYLNNIHIIDADGGNRVPWCNDLFYNGNPAWSPDGKYIVMIAYSEDTEIYLAEATDGWNRTEITSNYSTDKYPVWSPTYTSSSEPIYEVSETQATESLEQMQVIVDALRLRDKPNTDTGDKIGLLEKDDVVEILQRWEDWVKVRTGAGLEGWACIELDGETFLTPAE